MTDAFLEQECFGGNYKVKVSDSAKPKWGKYGLSVGTVRGRSHHVGYAVLPHSEVMFLRVDRCIY